MQVRPAEVRPAEVRAAEVRLAKVRLVEVRLAQVRSLKARPAEARAAELRPIVPDLSPPLSLPRVPLVDALLENGKMFRVSSEFWGYIRVSQMA